MTDNSYQRESENQQNPESDALDHELDSALAKFVAIEPRAGLEERVLANLRSQREHSLARASWYWLAVPTALMIVAAASLAWRSGRQTPATASHQPPTVQHDQNGMRAATDDLGNPARPAVTATAIGRATRQVRRASESVATAPKLDLFPSPQPLSEQEKILASYVAQFQDNATLVARARMESLQQDLTEEAHDASIDHETGN